MTGTRASPCVVSGDRVTDMPGYPDGYLSLRRRRAICRGVAMLGVKDVFTTINCLGGAAAVCLCIDGRPFAAGIAVLLGYFLGDALDGPVARWTKTANEFGVEYDTIADHVAHCVAPAVITYTVYRDAALGLPPAATHAIAIGLAALLLVVGSVRH